MTHKWRDINHKGDPDRVAAIKRDMEHELTLAELRKARNMTQASLAKTMELTQGGISQLEHRADVYLSTLRSYVEALGGRLELTAVFEDAVLPISTLEELAEPAEDREAVLA